MSRSAPALSRCPVGVVPIVWNNVDLPDLAGSFEAGFVLDEISRLGFDGVQHGTGFPEGPPLAKALESRNLSLAEVYAAVACGPDGPSPTAEEDVLGRLELLDRSDGQMLVVALDLDPRRSSFAGRSTHEDCPALSEEGWNRLAALLERVVGAVEQKGRNCSFHPHVGTFVENPAETQRLAEIIQPTGMGLCLDVGHYLLGGGDPTEVIRVHGDQITHVHLKDVDPVVQASLRSGELDGFEGGLRARVFAELGSGSLALQEVLESLAKSGYDGWLMIEQDSTWLSPSEASAVSLRVAQYAMRLVG